MNFFQCYAQQKIVADPYNSHTSPVWIVNRYRWKQLRTIYIHTFLK